MKQRGVTSAIPRGGLIHVGEARGKPLAEVRSREDAREIIFIVIL